MDFTGKWICRNGRRVDIFQTPTTDGEGNKMWSAIFRLDGVNVVPFWDKEGNCRQVMGWAGNVPDWDLVERVNPQKEDL